MPLKQTTSSCRIIAVTNNKGGVGKTTSTVSIGSVLHAMGYCVLLVDLDPQANLTTHIGGSDLELGAHIGDLLAGSAAIRDVIMESESGLDFLPSSYELAMYEPGIQKKKEYYQLLRQALKPALPSYDFVLLDCPPSLQTFTYMALVAADAYVIPAEPEKFSYDGLRLVMEAAENIERRLNAGLQLLGIFFTRYNQKLRNSTHQLVVDAIRDQYGPDVLLSHVRKDSALVKAQVATQTIQQYAPASNGAADYYHLTSKLLTRLQQP